MSLIENCDFRNLEVLEGCLEMTKDTPVGQQAAFLSGAHVLKVDDPDFVTFEGNLSLIFVIDKRIKEANLLNQGDLKIFNNQ